MARALLIAGAILAARDAAAGPLLDGPRPPEDAVGIQFKLGPSTVLGDGAEDVEQPLSAAGFALHVRVVPGWYVDLTTFGHRSLRAEDTGDKIPFGIEGTTIGFRARPMLSPKLRATAGLGAGGGRAFVVGSGESLSAKVATASAGIERELYGDEFNHGFVGVEAAWDQLFLDDESDFRGGALSVRLTFSYYMGGSYISDCM